ncbi:hypothetical protein EYF80_010415 [Liparis tanakae]|uniref:Uncharacterized protein n=1 Tax=Liparis tanakae TaxID=230148 RepID=A0A4Z2INL0_9TELE|nr:hypothetical protein EYF80_010415 [Liparis tanakae]
MRLLVRVHVQQADGPVSFQGAFLAEDQQRARSTDLQVEGDGLADKGPGDTVRLHFAQLQGPGTKLHTDRDSFNPQLSTNKKVIKNRMHASNIVLKYIAYSEKYNKKKGDAASCDIGRTSVVTSLMKGKMALTFIAEEANSKHSARKPCLEGWALRCNLLQINTRSLQEAAGLSSPVDFVVEDEDEYQGDVERSEGGVHGEGHVMVHHDALVFLL